MDPPQQHEVLSLGNPSNAAAFPAPQHQPVPSSDRDRRPSPGQPLGYAGVLQEDAVVSNLFTLYYTPADKSLYACVVF